ncbi:MAG TPA: hypothetical protein VGM11_03050 [Acidobacteriaceae bacterium]
MERRLTVPDWLGFSWWWLLAATVLSSLFRPHLAPLSYLLSGSLFLWSLVQPAWLRSVYPVSRAVYWYLAAYSVIALLNIFDFFHGPAVLLADSWIGTTLMLAGASCYIAGTCYFAGEWRQFVHDSQGYELPMSYLWAMFFSVYYFQYKLHDLREDQRIRAERMSS